MYSGVQAGCNSNREKTGQQLINQHVCSTNSPHHTTALQSNPLEYIPLQCTTAHYPTLHNTILDCTILRFTALRYTTPHHTILHYATPHHTTTLQPATTHYRNEIPFHDGICVADKFMWTLLSEISLHASLHDCITSRSSCTITSWASLLSWSRNCPRLSDGMLGPGSATSRPLLL